MEASYLVKKEEYFETERLFKLVKNEEEISPKIEYSTPSYPTNHPTFDPFFNSMTLPWMINHFRIPYIPYNPFYQPFNSFQTRKRPICKPFKVIKEARREITQIKEEAPTIQIKIEHIVQEKPASVDQNKRNKAQRVSACKNYIGLVTAGFSRAILYAENGSEILNHLEILFQQSKKKYISLESLKIQEFIDSLRKHIHKTMCGKKVKKSTGDRDFKVRSSEELESLLTTKPQDNEAKCLRKEVLKGLFEYFFESKYYDEWISNGMMREANRSFFIKNRKEVQRKFTSPAFYKPKFNHNCMDD